MSIRGADRVSSVAAKSCFLVVACFGFSLPNFYCILLLQVVEVLHIQVHFISCTTLFRWFKIRLRSLVLIKLKFMQCR